MQNDAPYVNDRGGIARVMSLAGTIDYNMTSTVMLTERLMVVFSGELYFPALFIFFKE